MSEAIPSPAPAQAPAQAHSPHAVPHVYPHALAAAEDRDIRTRRGGLHIPADAPRLGLALSGGGIRSATFNLGFLQGLARGSMLRRIDFLSTVSGGGYIGSFFGAWVHRDGVTTVEHEIQNNRSDPVGFLRENGRYLAPNGAGDAWVALASHLRGWVTVLLTLGLFLFGWLLLGAAAHEWAWQDWSGSSFPAAACRPVPPDWLWWSPWWWVAGAAGVVLVLPIGAVFWLLGAKPFRLPAAFWLLVAAVLAAAVVKGGEWRTAAGMGLGLALVGGAAVCASERRNAGLASRERWLLAVAAFALLADAYFCLGGFRWLALWDWRFGSLPKVFNPVLHALHVELPRGSGLRLALKASAFTGCVVWAAAFFIAARRNDLDQARRELTELLAFALMATAGLALLALVDTLGGSLYAASAGSVLTGHVVVVALWAVAQWAGPKLLASLEDDKRPSLPLALTAGAGAAVVALALLALLSFWAHTIAAALGAGCVQWHAVPGAFTPADGLDAARHLAFAGGSVILLCALAGRSRLFLNLSSNLPLYAARLTRAYVGASNPRRRNPEHGGVTRPMAGDDVAFTDYHPEKRGGPLHLVNITINETVLGKSQLEQRDRHGLSLALGPRSISVGRGAHALLGKEEAGVFDKLAADVRATAKRLVVRAQQVVTRAPFSVPSAPVEEEASLVSNSLIEPLAGPEFHPLAASPLKLTPHTVEMLSLGRWVGVSGAAFSTGLGQNTSLGLSFLAGIFNVRLGYWWDSEIGPLARTGSTPLGVMSTAGVLMASAFPAQSHLFDELLARFHGPAGRRFWYLTDGGHFENTAAYELIRRRVPVIIVCDCGADPDYVFDDAGGLVRKARIDFGAEIRFCDGVRLNQLLAPTGLLRTIGTLDELKLPAGQDAPRFNPKHAALAEVFYDGAPHAGSLLLLVKPTVSGDEPADILNYRSAHPAFPQEPTVDQFFDEAQWESYRKLGELIGRDLFHAGGGGTELIALQQRVATGAAGPPLPGAF